MSRPRSSSTSASDRSRPAVIPAAVRRRPSRTWMASASMVTEGNSCASWSATAQCVVMRRPFRSPAWASTKAPLQTEPKRRILREFPSATWSRWHRTPRRPRAESPRRACVDGLVHCIADHRIGHEPHTPRSCARPLAGLRSPAACRLARGLAGWPRRTRRAGRTRPTTGRRAWRGWRRSSELSWICGAFERTMSGFAVLRRLKPSQPTP